ncbi:hypothetical protein SAMN05216330_1275 [Bradyrhizobium sp. Ghvi]|uniref:methyltransferase family protein n=1 Tax=Bradyrhizobium sp. Ghvi TaxID=1855319 RepID=UPI0008F2BFA2|nr:hypothetical protein [Bradyrhizobium sp. Ghvi]SFQ32700.1 hypothetical protein SAMN05216330_1275 [Bradyrhizobium sp. Ghvi]
MTIDPREKLLDLVQSHRVTAVIYVAARLGLAELLRDGPRTVDELASRTHADRDALARCSSLSRLSAFALALAKAATC